MKCALVKSLPSCFVIAALTLPPAGAEVVVVKSTERLPGKRPSVTDVASGAVRAGTFRGFGVSAKAPSPDAAKATRPADLWIFPWTIDDRTPDADSTFFSVRHQGPDDTPISITVEFYDEDFNFLASLSEMVEEHEVFTTNVRFLAELIRRGGLARGVAQVFADGPVSVDTFLVDFADNFASGSPGLTLDDFCANWSARFLRFPGTTGGTLLTVFVNGPLGSVPRWIRRRSRVRSSIRAVN